MLAALQMGTGVHLMSQLIKDAYAELIRRVKEANLLRSCADVTRLRDLLGVTCSTSLCDGLTMLLASEGVRGRVPEPIAPGG